MMTHDEMIAVIAHHRDGGKVQFQRPNGLFEDTVGDPCWNFQNVIYRPKPEPRSLWLAYDEMGNLMEVLWKPESADTFKKSMPHWTFTEYKEVLP